jgi:hypothetical protein
VHDTAPIFPLVGAALAPAVPPGDVDVVAVAAAGDVFDGVIGRGDFGSGKGAAATDKGLISTKPAASVCGSSVKSESG